MSWAMGWTANSATVTWLPRCGGVAVGLLTAFLLLLLLSGGSDNPLAEAPQRSIPVMPLPPPPAEAAEDSPTLQAPSPQPQPQVAEMPSAAPPAVDVPGLSLGAGLGQGVALGDWRPARPGLPPPPESRGDSGPEYQSATRITGAELLQRYYPRPARSRGIEGRSVVEIQVDAQGRATAVELLHSEPPGVFDNAARRAAAQIRYRPAQRDGQAQPSTVQEELLWRLP